MAEVGIPAQGLEARSLASHRNVEFLPMQYDITIHGGRQTKARIACTGNCRSVIEILEMVIALYGARCSTSTAGYLSDDGGGPGPAGNECRCVIH